MRGAGCTDRTHSLLKCTPAAARDKFGKEYVKAVFSEDGKEQVRQYLNDTRAKMNIRHK